MTDDQHRERLAAVEHERDEARAQVQFYEVRAETIEVLITRRNAAEAALLSLQTAVRELTGEMALYFLRYQASATVKSWADKLTALLPDTAGTTP